MTLEPWEMRLRVLLMETTRASDGVDFIPGTIWTTCLIIPCNMYLYIRSVIFQSTCMFEVTCYTAPNNDVQLKLTNTTLSIMRPSPRYRAMFRTQLQQWRPRLEDHWFQYKVYGSKIIRYPTVIVRPPRWKYQHSKGANTSIILLLLYLYTLFIYHFFHRSVLQCLEHTLLWCTC